MLYGKTHVLSWLPWGRTRKVSTSDLKQRYLNLVREQRLRPDACQEELIDSTLEPFVQRLRSVHHQTTKEVEKTKTKAKKIPRGIYLYGSVGTGKSMLMDLVYTAVPLREKKRVHFHKFMLQVHQDIHEWKRLEPRRTSLNLDLSPSRDAMTQIALDIAQHTKLLCFDEFQVTDIADALLMRKLFGILFQRGTVVFATSNTPPARLYENGVNREYFFPFIDELEYYCKVVKMDSRVDHRLDNTRASDQYFYPLSCATTSKGLEQAFQDVVMEDLGQSHVSNNNNEPKAGYYAIPVMMGRTLECHRSLLPTQRIGWFDFTELCLANKGAADYKALCEHYRILVLENIPQMNLDDHHNEARRFVTLVDELYEHQCRLICSAACRPEEVFQWTTTSTDNLKKKQESDEEDRDWAEGSSRKDLRYAVKRTTSRLIEMQSEKWIHRAKVRATADRE